MSSRHRAETLRTTQNSPISGYDVGPGIVLKDCLAFLYFLQQNTKTTTKITIKIADIVVWYGLCPNLDCPARSRNLKTIKSDKIGDTLSFIVNVIPNLPLKISIYHQFYRPSFYDMDISQQ